LNPEKSESTAQEDNSSRSSSPESSASEEFDETFSRDGSRAASRMTKDVLQKSQIENEETVEAGQSSEEASRSSSRMTKEVVENESEEQVPQTTESSEASRVASRMANNVLKNELTTAIFLRSLSKRALNIDEEVIIEDPRIEKEKNEAGTDYRFLVEFEFDDLKFNPLK